MVNSSTNASANKKEYYVIDLVHIVKFVWYRIWVVALAGIIAASAGFGLSAFIIKPTYSSSIMLYVNNSSFSLSDVGFSISSSQISAAQSLVKTYKVLLQNRTTLERVMAQSGVKGYEWYEISDMIDATSVNETEVMRVKVTTTDPYLSEKIANGIAVVLPQRVAEIVEGASMEVVDSAVVNLQKVAPTIKNYTMVGFILGVLAAIIILVIRALLDNTIHDEDYILQNYNYPILAKIPDLNDAGGKNYSYRYKYRYYKKSGNYQNIDPNVSDNTNNEQ